MESVIAGTLKEHGANLDDFRPSPQTRAVLNGAVPGDRAVALWKSLREEFGRTGFWPIIRGDAGDELDEYPYDIGATLAKVPTSGIDEILSERLAERIENAKAYVDALESGIDLMTFAAKIDASGANSFTGRAEVPQPWPAERAAETELAIHSVMDIRSRRPLQRVRFALLKLQFPHEAPACLGFGGWNDAPMPELQVAVLREWGRRYGAVPIAITGDVMECVVDRPPQTEAEAMVLAAQQWIFCDDIVGQGTQTIRRLAIEIWRSPRWFFWWD